MTGKPRQQPWWLYGFYLIAMSIWSYFVLSIRGISHNDYLTYAFVGVMVLVPLIGFVNAIIKQRAQFTIKNLMILTLCIAVLCSVYKCYGFFPIPIIIIIAYTITALILLTKPDK